MEPEEREMLKKTLELAQDNNKMLHNIKRSMFWGRVASTVYWVIIIGAAVGLYVAIDPYIDGAVDAYGSVKGALKSFGEFLK